MAQFDAVNNDVVDGVSGDILMSSGQAYGVVRALANSATIALLGVWTLPAKISMIGKAKDDLVEVNCTVTVAIGEKLYLSSIVPGKATNVAPAYPYFLGVVLARRTIGGVQKALISFRNNGCSVSDTQLIVLNGKPATGTITCIAAASLADNDRFTLSDGTILGKYEYRKTTGTYATGSLTCVAATSLLDNETFTLDDGVNVAKVFEYRAQASVYATGSLTCVAKASLLDNETFTLYDGVNTAKVFEYKVTPNVYSTGSLTCVAKASLLDNETFTLDDGVNTAKVFEYKVTPNVYSTGSLTCVAKASLLDNESFTLDDGVNAAKVFEYQVTPNAAAIGSLTCVAKANLLNNETFTLDDGTNDPVVFEYNVTGDTYAIGTLTCVAKANLLNNETFTLDDGTNDPIVFEYEVSTPFTPTGGDVVVIDVRGVSSADEVAVITKNAIDIIAGTLAITATTITGPTITLVNDAIGPDGNVAITDTVTDVGFTHIGMSGGADFTATGGDVVVIDITTATTDAEVALATKTAINNVGVSLAITAGDVTTATIALTNGAIGPDGNAAITDTVVNAGFTHTGMSGGSVFTPAGGDVVVINISSISTDAEVALATKTAINNVGAALAITAGDVTTATIALTNDTYGAYNTAITDTVTDVGFTHTGMSGGSVFTPAGGDVVVINISSISTDAEVALATKNAINGITTTLAITAGTITDATIALTNDAYGAYNTAITDTVVNAGFTHTGMSGGSVFTPAGGSVLVIDITGVSTDAEVALATKTAINNVGTSLAITAGTITDATIALTNDAYGAYNTAITDTVVNAGFTHTGMSGGYVFIPAADVAIDVRGMTAPQVAAATKTAINNVGASLAITAGDITTATIALVNDVYGVYNTIITDTVVNAGFTHTGMSGGYLFAPTADYTTIDLRTLTDTSSTGVAVLTAATINAGSQALDIPVPTSAVINIMNKTVGTSGNVAMVKGAGSFTVSGMANGVDAVA